jgi:hypothetical protein
LFFHSTLLQEQVKWIIGISLNLVNDFSKFFFCAARMRRILWIFSGFISPNVPAVYDVLAARIRALRSKDQGRQNVAEVLRGNEAQRNDLAKPEPEPPTGGEHIQTCYVP